MKFRDFISKNWEFISVLDIRHESDALKIDWLQANWEMIVEQQLQIPPILLEVYGDGADNGKSSRIQSADQPATHRVICRPRAGTSVLDALNKTDVDILDNELIFDRFVNFRPDGWYYEEPPFEHALCYLGDYSNGEVVLNLNDIKFHIQSLKNGKFFTVKQIQNL